MAALRRRGFGLAGPPSPEDLFDLDQDHYGGAAAVEALALRAGITAGSRILDVCAGLGGPARVLAHHRAAGSSPASSTPGAPWAPPASPGSSV